MTQLAKKKNFRKRCARNLPYWARQSLNGERERNFGRMPSKCPYVLLGGVKGDTRGKPEDQQKSAKQFGNRVGKNRGGGAICDSGLSLRGKNECAGGID